MSGKKASVCTDDHQHLWRGLLQSCFCPGRTEENEHRTSNFEWENMKKQSLKPELLNDILQETEELIKIFVTSIKTGEKK